MADDLRLSVLIKRLRDYAECPMWADHAEIPKVLLKNAADALDRLAVPVSGEPCRAMPGIEPAMHRPGCEHDEEARMKKIINSLWEVCGAAYAWDEEDIRFAHKRALATMREYAADFARRQRNEALEEAAIVALSYKNEDEVLSIWEFARNHCLDLVADEIRAMKAGE